jgi:hypothetical protein
MSWNTPSSQFKTAIPSPSQVDSQFASDSSFSDIASSGASETLNQVPNAPVTPALPVLSPPHLITVSGKSYLLSVEQAAGTFMASVSDPAGVSATGSSAQDAQDNLDAILDTMA